MSTTIGWTAHSDNWGYAAGNIEASRVVAPASGTLTDLYLDLASGTIGDKFRLGVFSDDGGSPSVPLNLLLDAGEVTLASGGAQTIHIGSLSLALTNGVTYWFALLPNAAWSAYSSLGDQGTNASFLAAQTYGALPSTWPASGSGRAFKWVIYGTLSDAANPIVKVINE